MKVYYPDGSSITDINEFVAFYSRVYQWSNRDAEGLERSIERILEEGFATKEDIEDVVAWKTGGRGTLDVGGLADLVLADDPLADGPEALVDRLCALRGIGVTYAIAMLYFLSGGEWPIYDQFAHRGLLALQRGSELGDTLSDEVRIRLLKNLLL